jgi:hypothetical protein
LLLAGGWLTVRHNNWNWRQLLGMRRAQEVSA